MDCMGLDAVRRAGVCQAAAAAAQLRGSNTHTCTDDIMLPRLQYNASMQCMSASGAGCCWGCAVHPRASPAKRPVNAALHLAEERVVEDSERHSAWLAACYRPVGEKLAGAVVPVRSPEVCGLLCLQVSCECRRSMHAYIIQYASGFVTHEASNFRKWKRLDLRDGPRTITYLRQSWWPVTSTVMSVASTGHVSVVGLIKRLGSLLMASTCSSPTATNMLKGTGAAPCRFPDHS
jgi:hypothetical protein